MGDHADDAINRLMGGDESGDYGFFSRRRVDPVYREPRCNRCGSTDVRWRQQTGRWVLFSSQPGVVHNCSTPDLDAFDAIPE